MPLNIANNWQKHTCKLPDCNEEPLFYVPKQVAHSLSYEEWHEFRDWLVKVGFSVSDTGQHLFEHHKDCIIFSKTVEMMWHSCYDLPTNAVRIVSIQQFMQEYDNG